MSTIFCRSCSNLMAPREDRVNKRLVYYCKPCNSSQDADTAIVYRAEIVKSERFEARRRQARECCQRPDGGAQAAARALTPLSPPPPHAPHTHPFPRPASDQLAKVPNDIITDPTLERSRVTCPQCANGRAVRITPPVAPSDNRIKIIFVCCNPDCVHKWSV